MPAAVRAVHTYTYGYPKIGQLLCPGAYHCGRLTVVDISIPSFQETILGIDGAVTDGEMIRGFLKQRRPWDHKGTFGHVLVADVNDDRLDFALYTDTARSPADRP